MTLMVTPAWVAHQVPEEALAVSQWKISSASLEISLADILAVVSAALAVSAALEVLTATPAKRLTGEAISA